MQKTLEGFRLSRQQKRLWLLRMHKNIQARCAVHIVGPLDVARLKGALQQVIQRHGILRTTFHVLPAKKLPIQVIAEQTTFLFEEEDWRHLSAEQQTRKSEAWLFQNQGLVSQPGESIPFSCSLLTLADASHLLLLALPALCSDSYSLEYIVQELCEAYASPQTGPASEELVQYIQYAQWQYELLETPDDEAKMGRAYWQRQPELSALACPLGTRPHPPADFQPRSLTKTLPFVLVGQLEQLALRYRRSLQSLLFAAWHTLIWRLQEEPEINMGYVSQGRESEELQTTPGPFAETLPGRLYMRRDMLFLDIWEQAESVIFSANEWQEYFWWKIDHEEETSTSFIPICFEYEQFAGAYSAGQTVFSVDRRSVYVDTFLLKLSCLKREETLTTEFHYDSSQLSLDSLRYLPAQFITLLRQVVEHPETPAGSVKVVSQEERQLCKQLYEKEPAFTDERCIHQLFEEQARRVPQNTAVVYEDQQLTYAQLHVRSNQLAHYLRKKGVGPDIRVGICVERSLEMIVGLLGILKAGGAYVPLDPHQPAPRLALLLQDIQAPLLLSQQQIRAQFSAYGTEIFCLDSDWGQLERESSEDVHSGVTNTNLAYVLFTSGSTGQPKGVAIEHRQLVSYTCSVRETLKLPANGHLALVSTFYADLGNTMLFPALCTGSCLHVVSEARVFHPDLLADYFRHHPISALKITPGHLRTLLDASTAPEQLIPEECLILGGEASELRLIEQVQRLSPHCRLYNHYGPTETTVGVLVHQVNLDDTRSGENILPLSQAFPGVQVYLLDAALQPVPLGGQGEIYIGGETVGRGYLWEAALTAEKFLPDPYSQQAGARLYKTGDTARYRADGSLIFLGRADAQVKYHGHRVELDEIRSVLLRHPALKESVVVVTHDAHGNELLVAYYVSRQEIDQGQLRSFLSEHLLQALLPNVFVHLYALPLTANGKVNKQALPSVDDLTQLNDRAYAAPGTPVEQTLAEIWSRVLNVKNIGVHDNFFDLRGDSILGIQIIAAARQAGIDVTLKQLFEEETIARIAAVVNLSAGPSAEQEPVTGPVALIPIQRWFFEQQLPQPEKWSIVVHLLFQQTCDPGDVRHILEKLILHHDMLRSRFTQNESWQNVIAWPGEAAPLDWLDLSTVDEAGQSQQIAQAMLRLQTGLDLSAGPLVRATYVRMGDDKPDRFLLALHRLVIDGVSWRILLEHFQLAYEQLKQGKEIDLPPKTTSYKYWAHKLGEYAQAKPISEELNDWRTKLAGISPTLPVDFALRKDVQTLEQSVSLALTVEETRQLLEEMPGTYHTEINEVLLTALVEACAPWTGQRQLLVALEGHGREELFEDVDLSRTVGWFTSLFPVVLEKAEGGSVLESLKRVKTILRELPRRGSGYGLLRYLAEDPAIRQTIQTLPQPELFFRYAGQFHYSEHGLFLPLDQQEPLLTRTYRLMVISGTVAERFQVSWCYDEALYRRATIERLALSFMETLRQFLERLHAPPQGEHGYIPADFPLTKLDQHALDKLLKKLGNT